MSAVLAAMVSNVILAGGLALIAFGLTRVWRNPQVAHALWLLVLIKLVTPPVWHMSIPEFLKLPTLTTTRGLMDIEGDAARSGDADASASTAAWPVVTADSRAPAAADGSRASHKSALAQAPNVLRVVAFVSAASSFVPEQWRAFALTVWSLGTTVVIVSLVRRHRRFRQVLAASIAVNAECQAEATKLGETLGLRRVPDTRATNAHIPPLVHAFGWKAVVLLPRLLIEEMDREQRQSILAHELAHLRRRDHWVRWFEVFVVCLYWWNPVVWWARRMLRQAAEECCDAWVVWALPHSRRSYGRALLQTIEFLTEREVVAAVAASAFGGFPVKRRIEMIMQRELNTTLSRSSGVILFLIAALVLPAAAQTGPSVAPVAEVTPRLTDEGISPDDGGALLAEARLLATPADEQNQRQAVSEITPGDPDAPGYVLLVRVFKNGLSATQGPAAAQVDQRFKLVLRKGVPGMVRICDSPTAPGDSKRENLGIYLRATVLGEKVNEVHSELAVEDIGLIDGRADVHRLISIKPSAPLGVVRQYKFEPKALPGLQTFTLAVYRLEEPNPRRPVTNPRTTGPRLGPRPSSPAHVPTVIELPLTVIDVTGTVIDVPVTVQDGQSRSNVREAKSVAPVTDIVIPSNVLARKPSTQEERLREIERKLERILEALGQSPRRGAPAKP